MSRLGGRTVPPGYRADIQGLRALAVLLVLLYHAGVPWLPGGFAGVDVFFVISGYVITGLLVSEVLRTGTVDLGRFWSRRARRLLPASALVLVATALLTLTLLPQVRWRETGWDIVTSGLYVVNWRLADRSVDYLAEDSVDSPVQQYWSLAVEEQFYVLWPLLLLLAAWVARRRGVRLVPLTAGLLAAVVVLPSFAWAVHLTSASPPEAYFVTSTRLWQLGVGALVALGSAWWSRVPVPLATALAWGGPALVVAGAVLTGPQTPWPGWAALVPTLGTAAAIVGGVRASETSGPVRVHRLAPLQWTGALSYSLYLWHWPLLVVAEARWGEPSVWVGLGVVLLSALPATAGYLLVEQPVRHARGRGARPAAGLAVGALCTVLATASGWQLVREVDRQVRANEAAADADGAAALEGDRSAGTDGAAGDGADQDDEGADGEGADGEGGNGARGEGAGEDGAGADGSGERALASGTEGAPPPDLEGLDLDPASITPDPLEATRDLPALYRQDCDATGEEVLRCAFGDPEGDLHVAVVGDSKIAQWTGALDELGEQRGWRVDVYYRSACPWSAALAEFEDEAQAQACRSWGAEVTRRLVAEPPDVVLTSSVKSQGLDADGEPSGAALAEGMAQHWREVGAAGVPVVAVADTPQPGDLQVYACVADHRDDLDRCSFDSNDGSGTGPLLRAVEAVPGSTFVTMNDWVCPGEDRCPPVVGGVLVYRQGSHITDTYARSLADVLGDRLEAAFDRLGVTAGADAAPTGR
ncbi:hypothetical protein AVL62_01350 [Serinicoccus chungangensis]|uniref:Acyltransferase n=1 Tax=Serinicoccus chungangensis TaxID=767452 RepID=A0A0W8I5C1_9MICO|nr:acyltransferase family protein [Serinicoccus chungangensis]KUG53469.1 hypothetical protein AVL62_01350 [Serinicoccus chungangensis]